MPLVDDVSAAIADAMRKHDAARLSALRMLKAAFMNREVEKGRALDDAEAQQVVELAGQAAARLDRAVHQGRPPDLADKETAEIAVLEALSAAAVDPAAIEGAVPTPSRRPARRRRKTWAA